MKILQVVRQFLPGTGGMETYVSSLCRELGRAGHQSDVATLDYIFKTDRRLPSYERIGGIDVIRLPSFGSPRYFLAPRLLELAPRYDVIHIHGVDFFVDLMGGLRRMHGKPLVLSTHGGFFHTGWMLPLKKAYFSTVTRLTLRGVDRVIACSPQDEALFRTICPDVTLVENAIEFAKFAGVEKQPDRGTMAYVGRLSRNKGLERLVRLMPRLLELAPDARLVMIGPDWEGLAPGLEEMAAGLGVADRVDFTGRLSSPELLAALAHCRLFVSASRYEAFGLSAMEAMATGTVPVLSDIEAFRGFVRDGENGFIVDFDDEAIATAQLHAALSLEDESLAQIGARARETASAHDWAPVARQIEEIYRQVAQS